MKKVICALLSVAMLLMTFSACGQDKTASDEEEILQTCAKLNEAKQVWREFISLGDFTYYDENGEVQPNEELPRELNPYPEIADFDRLKETGGTFYNEKIGEDVFYADYRIVENYDSIEQYKAHVLEYYCEDTAKEWFFKYFDEDGIWGKKGAGMNYYPYLLEADGRLWADGCRFDAGYVQRFLVDTVKILSCDGKDAEIEVTRELYDSTFEKEFTLTKENGVWKFSSLVK